MSTVLTYLYAALGTMLVELTVSEAGILVMDYEGSLIAAFSSADPRITSGAASSLILDVVLSFASAFILLGTAWNVSGFLVPAFKNASGKMLLVKGVFSSFVISLFALLILVVLGGVRSPASLGLEATWEMLLSVLVPLLGGLVWGAVFWLRAQQPSKAGLSA